MSSTENTGDRTQQATAAPEERPEGAVVEVTAADEGPLAATPGAAVPADAQPDGSGLVVEEPGAAEPPAAQPGVHRGVPRRVPPAQLAVQHVTGQVVRVQPFGARLDERPVQRRESCAERPFVRRRLDVEELLGLRERVRPEQLRVARALGRRLQEPHVLHDRPHAGPHIRRPLVRGSGGPPAA